VGQDATVPFRSHHLARVAARTVGGAPSLSVGTASISNRTARSGAVRPAAPAGIVRRRTWLGLSLGSWGACCVSEARQASVWCRAGALPLAGRFRSGLWSGVRGRSLSDVTVGAVLHAGGSGQWRSTAGPNGAATKRGMVDPRRGKAKTGWVSRSEERKPNQGESLLGGQQNPFFVTPAKAGVHVSAGWVFRDRIGARLPMVGACGTAVWIPAFAGMTVGKALGRGDDKGSKPHKTKRPPQGSGRFTDRVALIRITCGSRVCRRPGRLP